MSGVNTKDSKISRILTRVTDLSDRQLVADDLLQTIFRQQKTIESQQFTLAIAAETANRLEAENDKLRKYLGGELFARRQREIPTLEPLPGMPAWDGTKVRNELRLARAQARIGLAADGTRWDLREILTAIAEGREIRLGVTGAPSLEPAWGNRPDPVPHTTKETV